MGMPNIDTWNLSELLELLFSHKEVLYEKCSDFPNFMPPTLTFLFIER